jgi:hypothetical protein
MNINNNFTRRLYEKEIVTGSQVTSPFQTRSETELKFLAEIDKYKKLYEKEYQKNLNEMSIIQNNHDILRRFNVNLLFV